MKKSIFLKNRHLLVYLLAIFILFGGLGYLARQFKISADQASAAHFPSGCSSICPEINVTCVGEHSDVPIQPEQSGPCDIKISKYDCDVQGLQSKSYSNSEFVGKNSSCKSLGYSEAENCCRVRGVYAGMCDPVPDDGRAQPECSQVQSGNYLQSCLKEVRDSKCDPDNASVTDVQACRCNTQELYDVANKIASACMCNEGQDLNGTDGSTCCGCIKECQDVRKYISLLPRTCLNDPDVSISNIQKACEAAVQNSCDTFNASAKKINGITGAIDSAKCPTGTGFDPRQCNEGTAIPDLPDKETYDKFGTDQLCIGWYGTGFTSKTKKIIARKCITDEEFIANPAISSGRSCQHDEISRGGCPEGYCSDKGGSVEFMCIKEDCNFGAGVPLVTPFMSSGSSTSQISVQKANAAENLSDVVIKVQRARGPYSISDETLINVGTTGSNGNLSFALDPGTWIVIAEKAGYQTVQRTLVVSQAMQSRIDIVLPPVGANQSVVPTSPTPTPQATPSTGSVSVTPTATPSLPPIMSAIPSTTYDTHQFIRGYNVVGSKGSVLTQLISQNSMTAFGFDPLKNNWDRYNPGTPISMAPNQAYYVYSPAAKSLTFPAAGQTEDKVLKPGWNFLWNHSATSKPNLKFTLQDRQGICQGKNIPLTELESKGISYRNVFIVKDPASSDACQVFSLLTGADKPSASCASANPVLSEVSQAPAKKGYWVFVFEDKIQNLTGYSCQ